MNFAPTRSHVTLKEAETLLTVAVYYTVFCLALWLVGLGIGLYCRNQAEETQLPEQPNDSTSVVDNVGSLHQRRSHKVISN